MIGSSIFPRASNDNHPIGADFEKIPEIFLRVYGRDLMDWAARLQERGQFLEIALWNRPDANVLSSDYWPKVTLRCDLQVNGLTKKMVMTVCPDSDLDAEIVAKHSAALPSIMEAQRAAAAANRGKAKGQARWLFDKTVPDYFVHRYADELRAWAHHFVKIGMVKTIVLREGNQSDLSPNPEYGAVLLGVKLKAKVDRVRIGEIEIVVSAASEQDEAMIRKHCEKLERAGIPAGMVLVEPPRAGVPFMPDHVK